MSTLALTQCWYTRQHHPAQFPKNRVDGAFYAHCRHCRRPIFSVDGGVWHIDGGFNIETLGDAANSFLSVVDTVDGMILARIPIDPASTEEEVCALMDKVREDYGFGEEGKTLELRDHRPGQRPKPSGRPRSSRKPLRGAA